MATNYPDSLDSFSDPGTGNLMNEPGYGHSGQHANANDAIKAIETFVGTTGSPGPALAGYATMTTTAWSALTVYAKNQLVQGSNGTLLQCAAPGESGATQPTWPTTPGDTVADGTLTWLVLSVGTGAYLQYGPRPSGDISGAADVAAIQSAINSLSTSGGGVLRLLAGTYYVNGTITVPNTVSVEGAGVLAVNGVTNIVAVNLGFDVFSTTGPLIAALTISSTSLTGTGGRAIVLNDVQNSRLRDLSIQGTYSGIYVTGGAVHIEDTDILVADLASTGRYGVLATGVSGHPNACTLQNVTIQGGTTNHPRVADGFVAENGYNTFILINCGALGCNRGLWTTAAGGSAPNFVQSWNFAADHCVVGMQLDEGGYACHVGSAIGSSYTAPVVVASTYTTGPILISAANITFNTGGITLAGSADMVIDGYIDTTTGADAVAINGTGNIRITGTVINAGGYGINLGAASGGSISVSATMAGNTSGNYNRTAGTTTAEDGILINGTLSLSGSSNTLAFTSDSITNLVWPGQASIGLSGGALQFSVGGNNQFQIAHAALGFYGTAPITQPTAGGVTAGYTAGTSTAVTIDGKFTGNVGTTAYTLADVVATLKNLGLIAQ